jgi:serine/threonine-protein kinase
VTLVVSSGPAPVAVPDLTGRGVGDATAALQQAGLVVQINYSLQPGDPVGTVLAESPPAATQVKRGSPVTLTIVVSGIVPDVSGMTLDQARTGLQNAGYTVGNVAYTQSGVTGKVANTEPGAGTALRPGEAVTIYFNDGGGEPPSPSAAPSPAPAATR